MVAALKWIGGIVAALFVVAVGAGLFGEAASSPYAYAGFCVSLAAVSALLLLLADQMGVARRASEKLTVCGEAAEEARRLAATEEHDRRIFADSDSVMPESQLIDFLHLLDNDIPYHKSLFTMCEDFLFFFNEEGHQYLSPGLRKGTDALYGAMERLLGPVAGHTFYLHEDPERYQLYPEARDDYPDGEARYLAALEEVREGVRAVRAAYRDYRGQVKRELVV